MPLTSAVPKALFPLVDQCKSVKAILHVLLEEVREAGIDDTCIVIAPGQEDIVGQYLDVVRHSCGASLPSHIKFIEQRETKGFGDAVLQAKDYVGKEPFVLLLADHVRISNAAQPSCISQVVGAFRETRPKAMVGVHDVDEAMIHTMGVMAGFPVAERVFRCMEFVEKPDRAIARQRLRTEGLADGRYLAHCGIYIFRAEIFDCLQEEASEINESSKELELAAAQVRLLQRYPESYYLCRIDGSAFDMGNPEGYVRAFTAMIEMENERRSQSKRI